MGYMRHHAIIVSSWKDEHIEEAHSLAVALFPDVSEIIESKMNGTRSFFIPPDGSKEGWEVSREGDDHRCAFTGLMEKSKLYLEWVEIQYGDDEHVTKIIDFGPK